MRTQVEYKDDDDDDDGDDDDDDNDGGKQATQTEVKKNLERAQAVLMAQKVPSLSGTSSSSPVK